MNSAHLPAIPAARRGARGRFVAITALLVGAVTALSAATTGTPASATGASALNGLSSADAAASCWEIKQQHPASADGVYWLRTATLERPEQFYCDMTTDGGGWVLIGRGREGWTFRDYGQSTPANIRTNVTGPSAFAPGALSTELIDGLLDGGAVKDLVDGVRVRRAADKQGTTWQEVRWNFLDLTTWSWAFGGGHRLATWDIDGSGGTGSNTADSKIKMPGEVGAGNRSATSWRAWFTYPWSGHGNAAGFSYAGGIDGENNSTSYLWERTTENNAIPFAQVFLRPRLTTPALAPIPAAGLPASTLTPLLDDRPAELAGGVWGVLKVGDSESRVDAPVLAITTLGDRVYVGGKFSQVRDTTSGQMVDHAYLAAFDRATGAWIPSFDPLLDGTVWDLAIVGGRLIVAGQFTNIDGAPNTSALTALDPVTGAVDPSWQASLTVTGTTERPLARAMDLDGDWLYVTGNFTRIDGPVNSRAAARLSRVRASDGNPDNVFAPDIGGVPYDVDAEDGRVYVTGFFSTVNGQPKVGVGVVSAADGSIVPGLNDPVWTTGNASRRYQQTVLVIGDEVWQGGSEHNTHVYSVSDYSLQRSHITHNRGGDTQAFARSGGHVYQGSHGNAWSYHDAINWPGIEGYTRVDDYKWVGAYDVVTHDYVPSFVPSLDSIFDEGVWELHTDVDGCVWFGGDIGGGPFVNGQRQYLEGFSKFCPRDTTAPTVPTNGAAALLTGGGIQLVWSQSTDDRPGFIGYEILRNDRVVSPLVYGSSYVDPSGGPGDRYFVRAVDPAGNRSATTTELQPGDNIAPSTPQNLQAVVRPDKSVDLTWTASTDDVAVTNYRVLRNGAELMLVAPTTPTVTTNIVGLAAGPHWLQVQALDAAGNESFRTPPVRIDIAGPDNQRPSVPTNLQVVYNTATERIDASWTASVDDTGVTGYRIRRNGVEVTTVAGDATTAALDLGPGGHYIQVEAFDAAGNTSFRTPPAFIEVAGPDQTRPSTPQNPDATLLADDSIDFTWGASTDNVAVTGYEVMRNGVVITTVGAAVTAVNLPGLGVGSHWLQVQALDAAGNRSFRTSPIRVDIAAPDTTRPTTPGNLAAVAQPDGSVIATWTASTDNVGVTQYRVLRNLVEVALVPGTELQATVVGLGTGTHYIQVQALDAAGNESFRTAPVVVTL